MTAPVLDVFPVRVTTPDGDNSTVRVLITDDQRALMFFDGGANGVRLIGELTGVVYGSAGQVGAWTVTGEDGTVWQVYRQGGCGCGNRLKAMAAQNLLNLVTA